MDERSDGWTENEPRTLALEKRLNTGSIIQILAPIQRYRMYLVFVFVCSGSGVSDLNLRLQYNDQIW